MHATQCPICLSCVLAGLCHGYPMNYIAPPKGRTLLMVAAVSGYIEVARTLLEEFGANVNTQVRGRT